MANYRETINNEKMSARSKDEFLQSIGIGAELAVFVTKFLEKPDHYFSISFEERREIENKIDAVIASFVRHPLL